MCLEIYLETVLLTPNNQNKIKQVCATNYIRRHDDPSMDSKKKKDKLYKINPKDLCSMNGNNSNNDFNLKAKQNFNRT